MIGRIRTRDEFQRLRRDGRRIRIEPFWCSHLNEPSANTALVAFAINRSVGNAVVRNRLRRRLRAILDTLELPPGLYLVGCRPTAAELTFDQIRAHLAKLPNKLAS
ncbi:MAG: ribonuclease P protein component [Ilumatobacter sp.]